MTVVLRREIGKNAADLISRLAASSTIAAIEEFIANSHDADAEKVEVTYLPKEDSLQIKDDGEGMTPENGLPDFYRLGDSNKILNPITSKGRKKIGKFGIATILLKFLAKSYSLETVKDGQRTIIEETFEVDLSSDKPIQYKISPAPDTPTGTGIIMRSLNFSEESDFDLEDLVKRVRWDMPILPDFKIFINEKEIVPVQLETAKEFEFEKEGEKMGRVVGRFFYTKRPYRDAGIHVYVHGRRIGNLNYFDVSKSPLRIRNRIVGIIHADELEDAILFDRGRFKEDDPGFRELTTTVRNALKKIRNEIDTLQKHNRVYAAGKKAIKEIRGIERELNDRLKAILSNGLRIQLVNPDVIANIKVSKSSGMGSFGIIYDPKFGEILIDETNPFMAITEEFNPVQFRLNIYHGIAEAIADVQGKKKKSNLHQFLERKQSLLEMMLKHSEGAKLSEFEDWSDRKPFDEYSINPLRVYSASEIAKISDRPIGVIRQMIETKVFSVEVTDRIRGEHAINALRKVEGSTSLYEIVQRTIDNPSSFTMKYRTVTEQFSRLANGTSYIQNLGSEQPCFFVRNEFVEWMNDIIRKEELNRVKDEKDSPLRKLEDTFVTVPQAADLLKTKVMDIARTVDFAKDRRLPLDGKVVEEIIKFRYSHLVAAYRSFNEAMK